VDAPVSHEVSTVRTPIHQFVKHPLLRIIELFELEIHVDRPSPRLGVVLRMWFWQCDSFSIHNHDTTVSSFGRREQVVKKIGYGIQNTVDG
jgi:hypothetical protein